MSELRKKLQISKLPPMQPKGLGMSRGGKRGMMRGKRDYTAVSWDNYFEQKENVRVNDTDTFCVYKCGASGPVCFFLHGGGFSALSWAVLSKLLSEQVTCKCAALDLRGHGHSRSANETNLCAEVLAQDVADVIQTMYGDDPPPIILVGHSMGGAVAVHAAYKELIPSLIGLAVIDVVEGTALEALGSMQSFLRGRPSSFRSLEQAIEWCVRTGQVRNLESAKVSMVGQVVRVDSGETGNSVTQSEQSTESRLMTNSNAIQEEDEDGATAAGCSSKNNTTDEHISPNQSQQLFKHPESSCVSEKYTWRVNLSKTEKFWRGWFEGLSQMFLSSSVPKMLLLAGVDRLDRDLTVGQMQGKFQMQVLPQCGHAVHEDVPDKVADVLATFMVRHRVAEPKDGFQRTVNIFRELTETPPSKVLKENSMTFSSKE